MGLALVLHGLIFEKVMEVMSVIGDKQSMVWLVVGSGAVGQDPKNCTGYMRIFIAT